MKKMKWLVLSMVLTVPALAQDFPGYRAGNYAGVNAVFFNPANVADSRYRWDFNLFSLNLSVANSNASFKLKDIGNSFDGDSLKNQVFGKDAGPASALMSINVVGPSVMFNVGKKTSFALTTRARTIINVKDIDGKLASQLVDDVANSELPYTVSSNQNQAVSVNGWTEFGVTIGRILSDKGKHFFKGGVSLKYLAGAANAYMNVNNLNARVNQDILGDTYIDNATGGLEIGIAGVKISDFKADDLLSFKSTGFGADIGFVYEYRPNCEEGNTMGRDENKYKFRVGASLLDLGTIKYKKDATSSGAYTLAITGSEKFYLNELDGKEIDEYNSFFADNPSRFTPAASNSATDINVSLPTTLQLDVDYHFHRGFYLSVAGQIALSKMDSKPYNSQYYNGFTATPRFEGRAFGLYVPVSYNELSKLNAGVSLRFGPLFVGSGSVLTALFGDSKQVDMHFGLRFGGLQNKKP